MLVYLDKIRVIKAGSAAWIIAHGILEKGPMPFCWFSGVRTMIKRDCRGYCY